MAATPPRSRTRFGPSLPPVSWALVVPPSCASLRVIVKPRFSALLLELCERLSRVSSSDVKHWPPNIVVATLSWMSTITETKAKQHLLICAVILHNVVRV